MGHDFKFGGHCKKCGTRRHYVSGVNKYIYVLQSGLRTLEQPPCVEISDDGRDYSLLWEIIVFLLVCIGIYFLATLVHERWEQNSIEQYHSHITPATANDTI